VVRGEAHTPNVDPTPTFDRVLVPLDLPPADEDDPYLFLAAGRPVVLSPATRRTLELGVALASGGKLVLLHAPPSLSEAALYSGPEGTWLPQPPLRELDERAEKSARDALTEIAHRLCPDADVEVRARSGPSTRVILDEAADLGADIIVLATSGRGRASRFFLGSTADRVIRHAHCPVLVVPAEEEEGD
jgi:nucleotide-binding universal stress UspA family protein